jgi:hypothetical protein
VPLIIDGFEASLEFHIIDVLNLDLLLGSLMKKFFYVFLGSLDHKLKEYAFGTSITGLGPRSMKPLPKQDPLKKMMHVSLLASSDPVLVEGVEFPTPHENDLEDSLHLYEGE